MSDLMMLQCLAERAVPHGRPAGGLEKWQKWQFWRCFSSICTLLQTAWRTAARGLDPGAPAILAAPFVGQSLSLRSPGTIRPPKFRPMKFGGSEFPMSAYNYYCNF